MLCVLTLFTAEVKHCMVQHQLGLQMKQRKIKLAAVSFPSSGKICSGKYSANRRKNTMLIHLIIMASSFITALKQQFSPCCHSSRDISATRIHIFIYFLSLARPKWHSDSAWRGHWTFSSRPGLSVVTTARLKGWTQQFLLVTEVKFWERNYWRSEANSFCL